MKTLHIPSDFILGDYCKLKDMHFGLSNDAATFWVTTID